MRASARIALAVIFMTAASVGGAGERLRFEFFPQRHIALQGDWEKRRFTGNTAADSRVVAGFNDVELRLLIPRRFTSPPQEVNIHLVVASRVPGLRGTGGLEVSWVTRGRFLAGTAHPGGRVLFFQGVVDSDVLSDFISFTFAVDARELMSSLRFDPVFEIELR
ncbi:MAG: hypothetical protein ACE5K1_05780 [Acidiferrobacterales bacterium]